MPPAFTLSQDQTLQLESVGHKTRLIACFRESVLVSFNTPLGRADRFRPAPPGPPCTPDARRLQGCGTHSRFAWARTVHLAKTRRAYPPIPRLGSITPRTRVSTTHIQNIFHLFGPRWHGQRPRTHGVELPATPLFTIPHGRRRVKPILSLRKRFPRPSRGRRLLACLEAFS